MPTIFLADNGLVVSVCLALLQPDLHFACNLHDHHSRMRKQERYDRFQNIIL